MLQAIAPTAQQTIALAQSELTSYLEAQATRVAAPEIIQVKRPDCTYLTVTDRDSAPTTTRLMVQLEDRQGNEQLVDLVTNNDRLAFITKVIRSAFTAEWRITESWEVVDGAPF